MATDKGCSDLLNSGVVLQYQDYLQVIITIKEK